MPYELAELFFFNNYYFFIVFLLLVCLEVFWERNFTCGYRVFVSSDVMILLTNVRLY